MDEEGRTRSERIRRRRSPEAFLPTELASGAAFDLFCAARQAEDRRDLTQARALYRRAARGEGLEADAFQALGRVERAMGELFDAIRSLTLALHGCEDDPDQTAELYVEIGDIHAQLDDYEEAAYYYRRATRLAPDDPSVRRRLSSASGLAALGPAATAEPWSGEEWLDQTA